MDSGRCRSSVRSRRTSNRHRACPSPAGFQPFRPRQEREPRRRRHGRSRRCCRSKNATCCRRNSPRAAMLPWPSAAHTAAARQPRRCGATASPTRQRCRQLAGLRALPPSGPPPQRSAGHISLRRAPCNQRRTCRHQWAAPPPARRSAWSCRSRCWPSGHRRQRPP